MKNINLKCNNILIEQIKTSTDPDNYWALIPCIWVDGKGQIYTLPTFDWEKLRLQTWYSAIIQPPRKEGYTATVVLQSAIDREGNPVQIPQPETPFDDPHIGKQYFTADEILEKMQTIREQSIKAQSDMRTAAMLTRVRGDEASEVDWGWFVKLYQRIKQFREAEEKK